MSLRLSISEVLVAHAEVDALACVDLRTGAVLVASTRGASATSAVEIAALVAAQVSVVPRLDAGVDEVEDAREVVVVSDSAVHAFARAPRAHCGVVAVARAGMNVALLLESVRGVADGLTEEPR